MIQLKALTKKYRNSDQYAINGIDLEIARGEVFGLLGPNGAGKTTCFSVISGLLKPTSGQVLVGDKNIQAECTSVKKMLGVVPQAIALYPGLTAWDNLIFIGSMYGLRGTELHKLVSSTLDEFGFGENRHWEIERYSEGMKRKINLIGGILHRPQILLLDEPTMAVDVRSRIAILNILRRINREWGTTILYTSHHLEQAEQFCDRVAFINHGRLIACGTPRDLIENASLQNLEELFVHLTGTSIED